MLTKNKSQKQCVNFKIFVRKLNYENTSKGR